MKKLKTIKDLPVDGKTVIVRVDFNVSIGSDGVVDAFEDYRLTFALPTLHALRQRRCRLVLLTHLGRPKKKEGAGTAQTWDLEPVHYRLQQLLSEEVVRANHLYGLDVKAQIAALEPGGVLLLPNSRLDERETKASPTLARDLASLAEAYVNEAFSVCHRAHTSVALLPRLLPACAGLRTAAEVKTLSALRDQPEHPYVAIVSGAKIVTKVGLLRDLLQKVDYLCVGGRIANIFLCAQGKHQAAYCDEEEVAIARELLAQAGSKLIVPTDVVIRSGQGDSGVATLNVAAVSTATVSVDEVPADAAGIWDIGPNSVAQILKVCQGAKTVLWNGPVGMCEVEAYAKGTEALAKGLAQIKAYRVVGGGDTVTVLERLRLVEAYDHVSVGGGAMLAFLEGKPMPGLEPLYD